MKRRRLITILVHAFVGWEVAPQLCHPCGNNVNTERANPPCNWRSCLLCCGVSNICQKFNYTTPLQTAIIFVVALLINRSLEMFASFLGPEIPFVLIFTSTYLTGLYAVKSSQYKTVV